MKVFAIYLNETEEMILVCAKSEKQAMELFLKNEASPIHLNGIDLEDVKITIYSTRMIVETNEEGIEEYCVSTDL